jgi:inosine-uridine nucleoside N-ribohydrolase
MELKKMNIKPFIIDTDMALDDWMAILYLLEQPNIRIEAITVAATGEAHAKPGVRNALRLLALADHELIPIAAGSEKPLQGDHVFPWMIRFAMDHFFFLKAPKPIDGPSLMGAVDTIAQALKDTREPINFVAIGPLTNLATVINEHPDLVEKIAGITFMGGALDVPGNIESINKKIKNPYAEWNVYIDPLAADMVFRSGIPITLVPLDATNQVPITQDYLNEMESREGGAALEFVQRACRRVFRLSPPERMFYFWDPLAAVVALHPEIGKFEQRMLRVVTEEGSQSGRLVSSEDGAKISVCKHVDKAAFERLFLEGII